MSTEVADFMQRVEADVEALARRAGVNCQFDEPILPPEIEQAIKRLKRSAPGEDQIHAEFLQWTHGVTVSAIALLFDAIWKAERWPTDWCSGTIVPLFKKDGSRLDPANYRGIALTSVLTKLFEHVLLARMVKCGGAVV